MIPHVVSLFPARPDALRLSLTIIARLYRRRMLSVPRPQIYAMDDNVPVAF